MRKYFAKIRFFHGKSHFFVRFFAHLCVIFAYSTEKVGVVDSTSSATEGNSELGIGWRG